MEGLVLYDIGEVGGWHAQQREGHLLPLYATTHVTVDFSPRFHPETLIDTRFGVVVTIFTSEHIFHAKGVTDGEDGRIEIDFQPALLGVDKGLTRCKTQFGTQLSSAEVDRRGSRRHSGWSSAGISHSVEWGEKELSAGLVLLSLQLEGGFESPVFLAFEGELLTVIEHHLIDLSPFERGEDIILVSVHKLIGWRTDIIGRGEGECTFGELPRQILLFVE